MVDIYPTDQSAISGEIDKKQRLPRVATVKKVFPHTKESDASNHEVVVKFATGGRSNRMPVAVGYAGETRLPQKGDTVLVGYAEGRTVQPYVKQAIYTDTNRAPKAEAGTWSVNQNGARIELNKDGKIMFRTGDGAKLVLEGNTAKIKADKFESPNTGPTQPPGGGSETLPDTSPNASPQKRAQQAGIDIQNTVTVTDMADISGAPNTLYIVDGNNGPLKHNGKHGLGNVNNVAICGKNGARLKIPSGFRDYSVTTTGGQNLMWSGIDIDQRATGAYGRLNFKVHTNGFYEYFKAIGSGRNPASTPTNPAVDGTCLHFPVLDSQGTARAKNVSIIHGGIMGNEHSGDRPSAMFYGPDQQGTLNMVNCQLEEFPNNGIYAANMPGRVNVRGGRYYNNNVCQIRLSNGSAKNATVGYDYTNSGAQNANNTHGTKGIVANQKKEGRPGFFGLIQGCTVEFLNVGNSGGCINTYDNYGGARMGTVKGCKFIDHANATTINTDGGSIEAVKNCKFSKSRAGALAGNIGTTSGNQFNAV